MDFIKPMRENWILRRFIIGRVGLLIVVILVSFACSSLESDWEKAKSDNSIHSYKTFLIKHKDSKYADFANRMITRLEYEEAKKVNTINAYNEFLKDNSNSRYASVVRERIKQLTVQKLIIQTASNPKLNEKTRIAAIKKLTEPTLIAKAVKSDNFEGRSRIYAAAIIRLGEIMEQDSEKKEEAQKIVFKMLNSTCPGTNLFTMSPSTDINASKLVIKINNKHILQYFQSKELPLYCAQLARLKLMLSSSFIERMYGKLSLNFNLNRIKNEKGYWQYNDGRTGGDYNDEITIYLRDTHSKLIYSKTFDKGNTSKVYESGDHISFANIDLKTIRHDFIRKLRDQKMIATIAKSYKYDYEERLIAIGTLKDQDLLAEIAVNDRK